MPVFLALRLCIDIEDHRNSQLIALGKGHFHHLPHEAAPLIGFPHANQSHIQIGLLFPVQLLAQPGTALGHHPVKTNQLLGLHCAQKPLRQRKSGRQGNFLTREQTGEEAFPVFSGGIEHSALHRHAHIAADKRRGGIPAWKCRDQAALRSIIIVTKGMADVLNDRFVQCCNLQLSLPLFIFCCTQSEPFQAEITAVSSPAQRFCAAPEELRVHSIIGDVIAVAEAAAKLRTAVLHTGIVIWTLRHINTASDPLSPESPTHWCGRPNSHRCQAGR